MIKTLKCTFFHKDHYFVTLYSVTLMLGTSCSLTCRW